MARYKAGQEGMGGPLTTEQVIRWWESRRRLYNVVLLAIGVAAIACMEWPMTKVIPMPEGFERRRSPGSSRGHARFGDTDKKTLKQDAVVGAEGRESQPSDA